MTGPTCVMEEGGSPLRVEESKPAWTVHMGMNFYTQPQDGCRNSDQTEWERGGRVYTWSVLPGVSSLWFHFSGEHSLCLPRERPGCLCPMQRSGQRVWRVIWSPVWVSPISLFSALYLFSCASECQPLQVLLGKLALTSVLTSREQFLPWVRSLTTPLFPFFFQKKKSVFSADFPSHTHTVWNLCLFLFPYHHFSGLHKREGDNLIWSIDHLCLSSLRTESLKIVLEIFWNGSMV